MCVLLAAAGMQAAGKAEKLYRQGRAAEQRGDVVKAYLLYAEAAAHAPHEPKYWLRSEVLRTQAARKAGVRPKLEPQAPEAGDEEAQQEGVETIPIAPEPQPPVELKGAAGRHSFRETGNARQLWENVAGQFGLRPVFDTDYRAEATLKFELEEADFRMALRALEAATGSFVAPLTEEVFLVVEDNPARRRDVEPTATVVIPLPEPVSLEDVNAVAQAVRGSLDTVKLFLETQRRLLVLRDRVSKVPPAQAMVEQLLTARAEVILEVELLEVSRERTASFGLALQKDYPLVYTGGEFNYRPALPAGYNFFQFGGGKSKLAIGTMGVRLFATLFSGESKNLLRAQLRSVQGQAATLHAGARFPVLTAGYFGPYEDVPGQTYRPPPSFQFEELGLVLKVTPFVHGASAVTLQLETEFKLLTGQSINDIPVIANRKFSSAVRVGFDEWALVGGVMTSREARNLAGIAGLAQLPLLGPLFRENTTEERDTEVLLAIRPRLVRPAPGVWQAPPIRAGSETRPPTPF